MDVEKTASVRDQCPQTLSILHLTLFRFGVQKEQGGLQERISALELKCSELETSARDLMEDLEREKRSVRSAEATLQQQQFAEENKRLVFEAVERELKILLEESRKEANDSAAENQKLQQEIATAKANIPPPPSPPKDVVRPDVVAALRAENTRLQNENEGLVRESKTIEERYKNSRLVRSSLPPRRSR